MALPLASGFRSVLLSALLAWPLAAAASGLEPATGEAPPLALETVDGQAVSLDPALGRPVLVHFFATWCPPCIPEMAALDRLAARRAGQPLVIVTVSVAEVDAAVRRFFAERPTALPVLMDRDRATARAWGVTSLPTSVLLDAGHHRVFVANGEVDWDGEAANALIDGLVGGAIVPDREEKNEKT